MKKWNVEITDSSWAEADSDKGGAILFKEFCDWAIKKSLDLEKGNDEDE